MTKPNQKVKECFNEIMDTLLEDYRQIISDFMELRVDSALTKQKKKLVEEITEELKKQIIYIRARTEREYRDYEGEVGELYKIKTVKGRK